jgi:asparagine synthase (glutamine-hydrolysing)
VFYYASGDQLVVSNSIKAIMQSQSGPNTRFHLDNKAAYYLLTFGYMLHDLTLVKEIRRLKPGHYLVIENNSLKVKQYYQLSNSPDATISAKEAIEHIDLLFRKAIKLEFDKDLEYGFEHLSSLSGGLDSRMTTWVAHEMGYVPMTNFTFSQTDYLDMSVAQNIANNLKHEWVFKSLDHGPFLTNLDEVISINEGISTYSGQTHGKRAVDLLNTERFGVFHTGMIGDVIIGSFLKSDSYASPSFGKMTSDKLIHKLAKESLETYDNQELFLILNRGFNGALTGNGPIQQFSEVASPFLDVDFMNYCLTIPLKLRKNHDIYKKWILEKYPKAANYVWESLGTTIRAKTINIRGKSVPLTKLPQFIYQGIQLNLGLRDKTLLNSPLHMNPFDYWYSSNPDLPIFFNQYYSENIHRISDPELKKDCEYLFKGTTIEKMQVLSLLSAIKYIWE